MNYKDAIAELKKGKTIARKSWGDVRCIFSSFDFTELGMKSMPDIEAKGFVITVKEDGRKILGMYVVPDDVKATDWEVR